MATSSSAIIAMAAIYLVVAVGVGAMILDAEPKGPFTATFDPGMTGTGFTAEVVEGFDADLIEKGESFEFTVQFGIEYNGAVSVIRGNGSPEALEPNEEGVYVVEDVRRNITILIEAPIKTFTITFEITGGITIDRDLVSIVEYGTTNFTFRPSGGGCTIMNADRNVVGGWAMSYSGGGITYTIYGPITMDYIVVLIVHQA